MNNKELESKIASLKEWEALAAEASAMVESIKDEIKAEMDARQVEELDTGAHILRWTTILSNRFDTTNFKKMYADLYKSFTKQVTSRRFTVSD